MTDEVRYEEQVFINKVFRDKSGERHTIKCDSVRMLMDETILSIKGASFFKNCKDLVERLRTMMIKSGLPCVF